MNPAVMARRARSLAPKAPDTRVSRNPAMRTEMVKPPIGAVRRTRTAPVGGSGDKGYRSEWNAKAPYFCPVEVDVRWSK